MSRSTFAAGTHVLVTGGSAGIGLELARCAARSGCSVTICSRNQATLAEAAAELADQTGASIDWIGADLGSADGVAKVLAALNERSHNVGVLINNAGFGVLGNFAATPEDEAIGMIDLNITAPVKLARSLLPSMIAHDRPSGILNVASVAGLQPAPGFAIYHATKAFVISWSHALREELKRDGVHVSCLNPGPVPTGFDERAGMKPTPIRRLADVSADAVARMAWSGLARNRATVTPGAIPKLMSAGSKLSPRVLVVASTKSIYKNSHTS